MLRRARNAGVEKIIVTAGTVKEAKKARDLVNTYGALGLMVIKIENLLFLIRFFSSHYLQMTF